MKTNTTTTTDTDSTTDLVKAVSNDQPTADTGPTGPTDDTVVEDNVGAVVEQPVVEARLTNAQLKHDYEVERDAAKVVHDPLHGKFSFQTWMEYKTNYNIAWDLAHPNQRDALPSTDVVLNTVNAALTTATTTTATVKADGTKSKSQLAQAIFQQELDEKGAAGLVRKDIIARFMTEAGLTKPGANTYYQNIRDKHHLVKHNNG